MSNKKFLKNLLATATVFGVVATGAMEASAAAAMRNVGAANVNSSAIVGGFAAGDGVNFNSLNAGNAVVLTVNDYTAAGVANPVEIKGVNLGVAVGTITLAQNTNMGVVGGVAGSALTVNTANHIFKLKGEQYAAAVGGTNPALVDALSHGCPVFAHANPYNKEVVGAHSPMWSDVLELERFFSADQKPRSSVNPREFIRRYNWADVTKLYVQAFEGK